MTGGSRQGKWILVMGPLLLVDLAVPSDQEASQWQRMKEWVGEGNHAARLQPSSVAGRRQEPVEDTISPCLSQGASHPKPSTASLKRPLCWEDRLGPLAACWVRRLSLLLVWCPRRWSSSDEIWVEEGS